MQILDKKTLRKRKRRLFYKKLIDKFKEFQIKIKSKKMIEQIKPVYDYLDSKYEWAQEIRDMISNIE